MFRAAIARVSALAVAPASSCARTARLAFVARDRATTYRQCPTDLAISDRPRVQSFHSTASRASLNPTIEKELRELGDKFGEARMEIEDAQESAETIYFNEDTDAARELVKEVLDEYERILSTLDGKDLTNVRQSWGLKMEQLKGELQQLENLHAEHD